MVSLPGLKRLSLAGMMVEAEAAIADGIHMIEVFPAVADELKTEKVSHVSYAASSSPTVAASVLLTL